MSESDEGPLTPDVPRPPGTPDVDLDIEIPEPEREKPDTQDVHEDAGEVEPPS
ncbi:hypothetical protein M8542_19285 [Amycolatopsis sp. OK19-0408]|uniref:Uncharacterized protein n=1 Tax=Amycolatopsis iheyensis TaxID=2945988 RepID=A0A9X2NBX4_9PSEU|nr:hypothetical protein [Amycolatopsis iheyensis]MCR6484977.1 hypothetical protein [Amycolatopsis iheyensis]